MRTLLLIVIMLGGALAAAWVGGETWLAREAAQRIAADPQIAAAGVEPLRELCRVGLALTDVAVETPQGPRTVAYDDIEKARTVFQWGGQPKPGSNNKKRSAS